MKTARPVPKNQPSAEGALTKQAQYTLLQITVKALPWLALQVLVGLVLALNAGGRAL